MHYFYILKSRKTGKSYCGITNNLKKRFYQHNSGHSLATKPYVPWDLVYYESYTSKPLAEQREKMVKQRGKVKAELMRRIGFDDA
jgi:putative endonuclease